MVEPLVNEAVTDLPFSYQFRVAGDRLTIHNFRMLLAGPNPVVGKQAVAAALGGSGGDGGVMAVLACCRALGTAVEGSYTAADATEPKPAPKKRTGTLSSRSKTGGFTLPTIRFAPDPMVPSGPDPSPVPVAVPQAPVAPPPPYAPPDALPPAGGQNPPPPLPPQKQKAAARASTVVRTGPIPQAADSFTVVC